MKLLKKSILLSLVAPLLFSLLSFTNAVAGEGKIVAIRIYECTYGCEAKIIISTNGEQKQVILEKTKGKVDTNIDVITNTFEQYYREGYKIEASNSISSAGANLYSITTYILTQ